MMDLTVKTIWAFFALCYIANYVNMLSLNEIIKDFHFDEIQDSKKKSAKREKDSLEKNAR